jgi:hypothetical protein
MLTTKEKTDIASATVAVAGITVATVAAVTISPVLMGIAAGVTATGAAIKFFGPSEDDKPKQEDQPPSILTR